MIRQTKQRTAILSVLKQTDQHPTAEWIHQEVRKTLPAISLGTVYRTLDSLCRDGEVRALDDGGRTTHFDGNPGSHAHIVCTSCGRIADVTPALDANISERVGKETGFVVQGIRLAWYGVCDTCQLQGLAGIAVQQSGD